MVHNGPLCLPTKGIMHLGELTGILFQMPAERDAVRHIRRVLLISLRRYVNRDSKPIVISRAGSNPAVDAKL